MKFQKPTKNKIILFKMKTLAILFILLSISITQTKAQQVLTAEEAINIALKNNFDILMARDDADIDKANNTAGNAGMLPVIAINAMDNYAVTNGHVKNLNGESNFSGLHTNTVNAGPVISWMLFDGGKMFVTKKRLSELEALGEIQLKERVMQMFQNMAALAHTLFQEPLILYLLRL